MTEQDRDELIRRVRAGEWLQTGDIAVVLRIGKKSVDRRIHAGVIETRPKAGSSWRLCSPKDVLRLLDGGPDGAN